MIILGMVATRTEVTPKSLGLDFHYALYSRHYGFSNNVGSRFSFIAVITYRHLGLTKNLGSKSPFCAAQIYRYHGLILRLDLIEYFLDRTIHAAEYGCLVGSLCHLTLCRRDRLCNLLALICLKFPQIHYQSPYVDAA